VTLTQQCQETVFKDTVIFCGKNGRKDVTKRMYTGNGMVEERVVAPCLDCTDLLTWTAWSPCTNASEGAKCRHRGNDEVGFEEERKVDCVMSAWSDWSGCSQSCDGGITTRSREIVEQPLNGGLACSNPNETKNCSMEPCPGTACGEAWEVHGDHCYYWSTEVKTWEAAEAFCQQKNGHLASITSDAINKYVMEGIKRRGLHGTWIGGNDIDEEGNWKWTDGSPFEFTFWTSGEPNNAGPDKDEDCLMYGYRGKWNDGRCTRVPSYMTGFLCSKKKGTGIN